jgi:hypothetical protein
MSGAFIEVSDIPAQDPAYRPTRPPLTALTLRSAVVAVVQGTFGAHGPGTERTVEGVASTAAGLGDQVAVQVDGGGDRAVAELTSSPEATA